MDIIKITKFVSTNFTFEDLFLLGILILLFVERKCDKMFIGLLIFVFISGLRQELLSFR